MGPSTPSVTVRAGPPVDAGRGGPDLGHDPGWRAARRLLRGSLRTLVVGQCLGQAGDGFAQVAFAQFVVFEPGRGATPGRLAALLAVMLLPFSVLAPFAGVLIDRWQRRTLLPVVSLVRALLAVGATGAVLARSEPAAFAVVLVLLSTTKVALTAKNAALPRTVAGHELVTGNAISAVAGGSAAFAGAAVGATFVGRSSAAGFVVAGLLYLAAGAAFLRLPDVGGGSSGGVRLGRVLADLADGLRVVGRSPRLRRPLLAVWAHRLLVGVGSVLLVLVADSRFHLRIAGYGLAMLVTGVASFAGTAAAPVCARRWRPASLVPVAFLPPALAAGLAGATPRLGVLVAGVAVAAFSFQLLKVLVDAIVGRASPDVVRGRVFAVYDVLYNIAFVLAGLVMIPLWHPTAVRPLLWGLSGAFAVGWLCYTRLARVPAADPSG